MLLVIFNWMYILATSFLCGYAFARLAGKAFSYRLENMTGVIFAGLVIATVYAQLASLIGGVGIAANIAFILPCAVIFAVWRKEITSVIRNKLRSRSAAYKITTAILISVWCYCTSRGYMHYDSDLYHAQSIRWIEEYGVAAGLGNIHVRFAYNSSFFALCALYSMRDIAGEPLHAVNGFIALLLSIETLEVFFRKGAFSADNVRISDFARLGAVYYLTLIYRDIVSPASDYCAMCVVFYIIIRWLSYIEEGRKEAAPYALLCAACVYGITLKLTAGVILLLLAKPLYILLREKRYRETALYFLIGTLVILPWLIRTALISGYLLYPFPALDVLDADWKIPKAAALLDAAEIKAWGRGLNNAALAGLPVSAWFPNWFKTTLPMLGKLFITADILSLVVYALILITYVIKLAGGKTIPDMADRLLVAAAAAASYLFWQLSAPLLRYGYAYVLLLPLLTAGLIYKEINGKNRMLWIFAILLAALKMPPLAGYIAGAAGKEFYVNQQGYGIYELDSFEVDGITFYYPKSGDRTGYEYFPSVPARIGIELRGDKIESGFKSMEK